MSNPETPSSDDKENEGWGTAPWICIGLAVSFVVAGGILAYVDRPSSSASESWSSAGARGDFWGGHLAAASGLAGTLILFAALLLQGKELKLQRKELRDSREVAEQQAEALDEQTSELKTQNENLKRQVALAENRDEIQLILSFANEVRRLEDTIQGPPHLSHHTKTSLSRSQERLMRLAARSVLIRFHGDRSNANVMSQAFFAILPERLHEAGLESFEAAAIECNPNPEIDPRKSSVYQWVQKLKFLTTEESV